MHPKALTLKEWNRLTKKFKNLDLNIWSHLDGLKKINLMRLSKIPINNSPIFGNKFNVKYPNNIYLFDLTKKINLDVTTLNSIRSLALYENVEKGGTIEYQNNKNKIEIQFSGNQDRIELDFSKDTHTLFHTHPKDDDRKYDPPSVLDILSYLALTVKYLAEIVLDLERDIEHPIDDPLIVQNCMVFTKDELYIYYISNFLVDSINDKLIELYSENENFVEAVEKLLEEMEIVYSNYLFIFNHDLDKNMLEQYLLTLNSLGIIIKRFEYLDNPKVYVAI